jgi:hypothetical protein
VSTIAQPPFGVSAITQTDAAAAARTATVHNSSRLGFVMRQ